MNWLNWKLIIWLLSNWGRILNWKRPGTEPQSLKLFKRLLKTIALAYIYQRTKFGDFMFVVKNIYSKMHLISCTNTHCDITHLVNHGMVKNTKTWISWEQNIISLWNKKILDLCFRWHILRSYCFVAEVTFNHNIFH